MIFDIPFVYRLGRRFTMQQVVKIGTNEEAPSTNPPHSIPKNGIDPEKHHFLQDLPLKPYCKKRGGGRGQIRLRAAPGTFASMK